MPAPNSANTAPLLAPLTRGEITLRQLAHFVAAAETGSMTGAAKHLQFSPSAISASIGELERALGAELCVRRRAQGVTPTPTGAVVLSRAKRLLLEVDELHYAVQGDGDQLVGPLVLGCYTTLASSILPRVLDEYTSLHPHVTIDFVVGNQDELEDGLLAGRLDAAITYEVGDLDSLDHFELYQARGYTLFGQNHPMASTREPVTLEELAPLPLVLFDTTPSARYGMLMFEARGLVPNVRHRTHAFELTRSIVARSDSLYAILVQRPTNSRSYEDLPIIERDVYPLAPPVPVVFAQARGTRPSARTEALIRLLHRQYPNIHTSAEDVS